MPFEFLEVITRDVSVERSEEEYNCHELQRMFGMFRLV